MKTLRTALLIPPLLACCALACAGPAPWYWWVSKVDGARVCSQTPLGPGWEQVKRPYQDSRCEKLAIAK
ncbi:hypothetical protein [Pseudoduganella namucuonensis]|uniref:DUF4124 domain-containing protein n=1 Tax=Pseudoduganella namucuonensis TaxID=1035707 RepID=A0A1I7K8B5_9BURK|nr:hypothetical protein [Pseudoduganella namucuonensis]SFU93703.1 hypothetical protein SAMN05216552_101590 [Pseudoduganella namucuonensis]